MAHTAPYLFDRTFEVPVKGSERQESTAARKLQEDWERKMAEACCTAYEEGREEGEAAALRRIEAETLEQVKILINCAQKTLANVERECDRVSRDSIEIAATAANLLAGELISRHPTINLEAMFREALEHIDDAPHIAITVNDAHAEAVQKAVSAVGAERGFTGKIVVLGDPDTKMGDCSLQWADGGITLDIEKCKREIAEIVRRHLDRLTPAPSPRPEKTNGNATADPLEPPRAEPAAAAQRDPVTETVSEPVAGSGEHT